MAQAPIIYVFNQTVESGRQWQATLNQYRDLAQQLTLNPQQLFETVIQDRLNEDYLIDNMQDHFGADSVSTHLGPLDKPVLTLDELRKELQRTLGVTVDSPKAPLSGAQSSVKTTSNRPTKRIVPLHTDPANPHLVYLRLTKEHVKNLVLRGQEAHHLLDNIADFLMQEHDVYFNPRLTDPVPALRNRCNQLKEALGPEYMCRYKPLIGLQQVFENYVWDLDPVQLDTLDNITVAGSFYSSTHRPAMPPAFVSLGEDSSSTYHGVTMASLVSDAFARKEGLDLAILIGHNDYYHA